MLSSIAAYVAILIALLSFRTELVFPVRPGSSSGNPMMRPSTDIHGSFSNSIRHPSLANEFSETNMLSHQNDKFHPFGHLTSELRNSSRLKYAQSSNMSSSMDYQGHFIDSLVERDTAFASQSSFGSMADQPFGEMWSDDYRRNTLSNPNGHLGSLDIHHLSRMEHEYNGFDMKEHLMSQKLQLEQLQQQNLLCPHPFRHVTGLGVENFSGLAFSQSKKPDFQQAVPHSEPDLEQLLALQRQFELQQQHQLQQQQVHEHELKLQQQQWQRQFQIQQSLHHQISHPGYVQSKVDPIRDDLFDKIQLRKHLLHELQLKSHSSRVLDPMLELIIQAKVAQSAVQGRQTDILDLVLQAKHGNTIPIEQQLCPRQELLQMQQLSMALKQQQGLNGERHIKGLWSVDEAGQFVRNPASHQQAVSAGFSVSDFYLPQDMPYSHEEQLNKLSWNHALQEQLQRGFYEPGSISFERPISLHTGPPVMNLASVNTGSHDLDLQEQRLYMHSDDQLGSFYSSFPSHLQHVSDEFNASHLDTSQRCHSGNSGELENSWIEARKQQLHLEAVQQRKELEATLTYVDRNIWASAGGDEETLKQGLMDLHKKLVLESAQSSEIDYPNPLLSSRRQETSLANLESNTSNFYLNLPPDKQICLNNSFMQKPQDSNSNGFFVNEQNFNNLGNAGSLPCRSNSGAFIEDRSFLLGTRDTLNTCYVNSSLTGKSATDKDLLELGGNMGKRHGSKGMIAMSRSVSEIGENLPEQTETALGKELRFDAHSRHSSLSSAGKLVNNHLPLSKSHFCLNLH